MFWNWPLLIQLFSKPWWSKWYLLFISSLSKQTMPHFPGQLLNKTCWELIKHMYCKFLLPKCDLTSWKPRPQPICKEACQKFNDRCRNDWVKVLKMYQSKYQLISWGVQSVVSGRMQRGTSLMWCKGLPKRNGPVVPECYYPEMLKGKRLTLFNVQKHAFQITRGLLSFITTFTSSLFTVA